MSDDNSPAPRTVWNIDLWPIAPAAAALAVAWFLVTCAESRERMMIKCMDTPRCEINAGGDMP